MIDLKCQETYQTPYETEIEFTLLLSTRINKSGLKDLWKDLNCYNQQEYLSKMAPQFKRAINESINQEIEKRNPKLPVSVEDINHLINDLIDSYNLLLAGIKPEKNIEKIKDELKSKIHQLKNFEKVKVEKVDFDIEKLFESFFKEE
jgi:hypothetical protein